MGYLGNTLVFEDEPMTGMMMKTMMMTMVMTMMMTTMTMTAMTMLAILASACHVEDEPRLASRPTYPNRPAKQVSN